MPRFRGFGTRAR